jgi:hypothetical protein
MRANLRARHGFSKAKFQDEDSKVIVGEEDFNKFFRSTKARAAMAILQSKGPCTKREAANVRNMLMTTVIIENVCRPSALYRLTVKGLMAAKKTKDGQAFVLTALYDKNVASSGRPTYLVLPPSLKENLEVYCNSIRSILAEGSPGDLDDIFLKEDGSRMDSESISAGFRYHC